ncbi:MAG: hypothetical protein RLQ12_22365 [Cyclobacteriaceae bacterium]
MSKAFLTLVVSLFLSAQAFAELDSLVKIDEISYSNSFEKNVFKESRKTGIDFFYNYMVFSSDDSLQITSYRNSLNRRVQDFKSGKRPKNNSKYVKKVYEFVHSEFLRKYESEAYFHQIFENGVYNCVTACALYGMVFSTLDIPFTIKETPTHVYIIAYPESDQIGIETTDPIGGFKTFSPGFKQNFVNQLVGLKLIDIAELADGVNAVFNRYYFSNKELGLKELTGIQYYNHGLIEFQNNNYQLAYQDMQKAYYLYPSENIKEILSLACLATLSKAEYDDWYDLQLFSSAITMNHPSFSDNQKLGEFSRLLNKQLIDNNDTLFVDSAFHVITALPLNPDLNKEITFLYNYERARKLYNRGNYKLAFPYSTAAYHTKPESSDSENLLVNTIQNAVVTKAFGSEETFLMIESLLESYPSLKTHGHLGELRSRLYLIAMHDAFENKNVNEAISYKNKFEAFIDEFGYRYDEYALGRAYSQGIMYYFRKGAYRNARNLLNDGLKYAPDNQDLKMRKYYLDRASN